MSCIKQIEVKMYYFIYKTTNQITQEYYIGKHCTENLNDGYIGTGMTILKKIKQFGKKHFYRNIIEFCNSYEELNEAEKKYITLRELSDPLCMNNQTGGDDGFIQSPETIEKIRIKNTGKPKSAETRKKMSKALNGRKLSEEHKNSLRLAKLYISEEVEMQRRKKISEARKGKTSNRKGVTLSDETKAKLKKAWERRKQRNAQKMLSQHCQVENKS